MGVALRTGTAAIVISAISGAAIGGGFTLLDDFESYDTGLTTLATGGAWHAEFSDPNGDAGNHTANSNIVATDMGNSLQALGGAAALAHKVSLKAAYRVAPRQKGDDRYDVRTLLASLRAKS